MRNWLVRVTAVEAYRGNRLDPRYWHVRVQARTDREAIAQTRLNRELPAGVAMVAYAEGQW